jgi:hypothetical protein
VSEIDAYRNQCIGIVICPTRFYAPYMGDWDGQRPYVIPLYRLEEDALDANTFRAKRGDLLLGGGSGECPALRVALPEAFYYFTHSEWDEFSSRQDIVEAFWTMTSACILGDGYYRAG